jgi:HlyD family secretion protein
LSLQAEAKELEARLYLDPADGKRVGRGMAVAIAPVSVRREEHGLMLGTVRWVAEFPATPQGLLRVLENQALVNEFSQGGAPIEVAVTLERDPHTASGFGWTSAQGPPIKISSGTLCEGSISVASQRPITKVLPVLKRAGL